MISYDSRKKPLTKGLNSLLFLSLLISVLMLFGCATAPAVQESSDEVAAVPQAPEPEPEPQPEVPEPTVETVYLLSRERTFLADGRIDSSRELSYQSEGVGLELERRFTGGGRLIQERRYTLENGRPVEERLFDEEGRVRAIRRYQYDSAGNLTMEEQLDAAEEFQTRSSYGYDSQGRRTSWQVFSSFAGLMGSTAYIYEDGLLVRIESLSPNNVLEEYFVIEHDEQGRESRRTHYDAQDRRLAYTQFEHEGEHLVREIVRRPTGAVQRSVEYEYDESGNVIAESHFDASGNLRERIEREYIVREIRE